MIRFAQIRTPAIIEGLTASREASETHATLTAKQNGFDPLFTKEELDPSAI
jgi:hypothetical protein